MNIRKRFYNLTELHKRIAPFVTVESFLSIGITAIAILLSYRRIFFGVDFSDEALSIAIPYRFLFGDRPFVDEFTLGLIPSSLLMYPFVKLYVFLTGGAEGIMLFMRHIYFISKISLAALIFVTLRKKLQWQIALLVSLPAVAIGLLGIQNLSYNTFGAGFFTAGCFWALWVIYNNKKPNYLYLSGFFHALAVFSYPTFLIPIILFNVILWMQTKKTQCLWGVYLALLLISLMLLPFLISAGWETLSANIEYVKSFRGPVRQFGGITKLLQIHRDLRYDYAYPGWTMLIIGAIAVGLKKLPKLFRSTLLFMPLIVMLLTISGGHLAQSPVVASMEYPVYYGLLTLLLLPFIFHLKFAKQLFYLLWLPSAVAGITTGWTSGTGYLSVAIGFFPSIFITSIFLIITFIGISQKGDRNLNLKKFVFIIPALVMFILIFLQYSAVYRDDKIAELNTKIDAGPYKGIFTTKEKTAYIQNMVQEIQNSLTSQEKKILFYGVCFPAGYLFVPLRPAANTVCLRTHSASFPFINLQSTIDYYQKNNIKPDIAFQMQRYFTKKNDISKILYPKDDPVVEYLNSDEYQKYLSTENYIIYKRQKK